MFVEPQILVVNSANVELPRVSYGDRQGTFEKLSAGLRLRFQHALGKTRNRRTARFDFTKTAADPIVIGNQLTSSMTLSLLADHPVVGYTQAELLANAKTAVQWLNAPGNLEKMFNGES